MQLLLPKCSPDEGIRSAMWAGGGFVEDHPYLEVHYEWGCGVPLRVPLKVFWCSFRI